MTLCIIFGGTLSFPIARRELCRAKSTRTCPDISSTVTGVERNWNRRAAKPTVGNVGGPTSASSATADRPDVCAARRSTTDVLPLLSSPTTSTTAACFRLMAGKVTAGNCPRTVAPASSGARRIPTRRGAAVVSAGRYRNDILR